jgi:hypothetical protein
LALPSAAISALEGGVPEVRFDQALTSQFKPFEENTSRNQWTIGLDALLEF